MSGAEWIGPALSVGGTLISAQGQRQAGKTAAAQGAAAAQNERVAAEFEARQADYLAGQALAGSQLEAREQRKAAALLASKALARAAASGAGASDPTVVDILSEIYSEGAYRSALALYEGQESARSLNVAATARRLGGSSAASARQAEGESIARASNLSMFSTLLRGGTSLLDQFGTPGKTK